MSTQLGDIIEVNGQPWPFLSTEPRKYRLRVYNMSPSRPYDLYFQDSNGNHLPFKVIASDSGLFERPVAASDVIISPGERYELVVDFSAYSDQNITLKNGPHIDDTDEYNDTDKVMMFVVGDSVSDSRNNGDVPERLNSAIAWPEQHSDLDHIFAFNCFR